MTSSRKSKNLSWFESVDRHCWSLKKNCSMNINLTPEHANFVQNKAPEWQVCRCRATNYWWMPLTCWKNAIRMIGGWKKPVSRLMQRRHPSIGALWRCIQMLHQMLEIVLAIRLLSRACYVGRATCSSSFFGGFSILVSRGSANGVNIERLYLLICNLLMCRDQLLSGCQWDNFSRRTMRWSCSENCSRRNSILQKCITGHRLIWNG